LTHADGSGRRLTESDAPQLWVVLNEAVIRCLVGERATMHAQLVQAKCGVRLRCQSAGAWFFVLRVSRWRVSRYG
jgi:Domain of unknown function (DUF5753)